MCPFRDHETNGKVLKNIFRAVSLFYSILWFLKDKGSEII